MRRTPTVVSMRQLEQGPPPAPSTVQACAGVPLPAFVYDDAAPSKPDSLARRAENSSELLDEHDASEDSEQACWSKPRLDDCAMEAAVPCMPASPPSSSSGSAGGMQQLLGPVTGRSLLDTVLLALWEDCAEQGLFRYDVTACQTKAVPGSFGFIAQLNEGRASNKRPTEVVVDKVCQPFTEAKFNFKKAYLKEVLLQFESGSSRASPAGTPEGAALQQSGSKGASGGGSRAMAAENSLDSMLSGPQLLESTPASCSPNLVMINVSPIEYGHVLLVPRVLDCLPQALSAPTLLQALHFAREADNPYFRVGFNSLGAYATINHLHFQAYYLAAPYPCERAPVAPLPEFQRRNLPSCLAVSRLAEFPVAGWVVEVLSTAAHALREAAELVGRMAAVMQAADIPHNVLATDCGTRIFVWPQRYAAAQAAGEVPAELLDTGVNPAVFEIAGHMVLKRAQDYEEISQFWAWRLLEQVSLSEAAMVALTARIFGKRA